MEKFERYRRVAAEMFGISYDETTDSETQKLIHALQDEDLPVSDEVAG